MFALFFFMIEYAKEKKKDFWKDLAVQGLKMEVFFFFFLTMVATYADSNHLKLSPFVFLFIINYIPFADMEKLQETLVTK